MGIIKLGEILLFCGVVVRCYPGGLCPDGTPVSSYIPMKPRATGGGVERLTARDWQMYITIQTQEECFWILSIFDGFFYHSEVKIRPLEMDVKGKHVLCLDDYKTDIHSCVKDETPTFHGLFITMGYTLFYQTASSVNGYDTNGNVMFKLTYISFQMVFRNAFTRPVVFNQSESTGPRPTMDIQYCRFADEENSRVRVVKYSNQKLFINYDDFWVELKVLENMNSGSIPHGDIHVAAPPALNLLFQLNGLKAVDNQLYRKT